MTQPGVRTAWMLALLVACDAGEKPGRPANLSADPPPKPQLQVAGNLDLAYLPASSDIVFHVDVAALRKSAVWPTYEHDIERGLLPRMTCEEYAPIRSLTTVDVGVMVDAKRAVFVVRGIDRGRMLQCLHAKDGVVTVPRTDKLADQLKVPRDSFTDVLTFVDDTTMIVQRAETTSTTDLSAALLARGAPLRTVLAEPLKHVAAKSAVTMVSRPRSAAIQKTWQIGGQLEYVYGELDSTAGHLLLKACMVLGAADQAKTLGATIAEQIKSQQMKQMFEILDASTQGNTVTMSIGMTDSQLATMAGVLRAAM